MWERIRTLLRKEMIQVWRDPRMRAVIFVIPTVQLLIFGYAATLDVRHVTTAIIDRDQTVASRQLIDRFAGSQCFRVVDYVQDEARARLLMDQGKARVIIDIDKGFQADLHAGRTAAVQLIVDGTDSNNASIIMGYSSQIAADFSSQLLLERQQRSMGIGPRPARVELRSRALFNENLESRYFYVPGVMANLITLITLMLTSMAVVREREIGTMEQVLVTPIRPAEFIIGKTMPFVLISFIDVILVTLVGVFWFHVPIRGSLLLLAAGVALFLMPAIGMGLLISTICRNQQQAMMSTFFLFFPAMLLSGFAFPIANMPEPIRYLTYANPLRYFLTIVRGIFLKGVGFDILWPQMAALAVIGIILITLAVKRFHKTLE